ncbi:hypothetical protein [Zoogloea dura]|uniref:hypothetical protein n=1 Tax=Zoogloea dura TaxID=2728840 RepID=UPI001F2D29B0|nr:hypothetical protein [Zoogloea dura]
MNLRIIPAASSLGTAELAELLRSKGLNIKPASIRRAHCVKGEYLGLTPRKLPNGRLLWPGDAVRRLLSEGVQEGQS